MARPLRIEYEGACYHVMNRGINHQNIYLKNDHREIFLMLLEEISIKFFIDVLCYCLMDNHYHLLLRTPIPNLGKAMRHLDGLYTRRFNLVEGRDGPIFRGRYKAILIEEESYLLQVSRYIHLNPIEAKICNNVADYAWSSYLSFIGKKAKQHWLKSDFILSYFKDLASYREFVAQGIDEEIKELYMKSSSIFGKAEFIKNQLSKISNKQKIYCSTDIKKTLNLPTIESIANTVSNYFSLTSYDLKSSSRAKLNIARNIAIFLSKRIGQTSHQEIARYYGNIAPKSLSTTLQRIEIQIISSPELKLHIDNIVRILN